MWNYSSSHRIPDRDYSNIFHIFPPFFIYFLFPYLQLSLYLAWPLQVKKDLHSVYVLILEKTWSYYVKYAFPLSYWNFVLFPFHSFSNTTLIDVYRSSSSTTISLKVDVSADGFVRWFFIILRNTWYRK